METSVIIIVGKPGAGKSSIGSELAKLLKGTYMSLGTFMRGTLGIPDPHIGFDKQVVYDQLFKHLTSGEMQGTLVLDCHPYPEEDLEALLGFLGKPSLTLRAVIYVEADDAIALTRLERRPRPGQTNAERLKYFSDHQHLIVQLMNWPNAIRVQNNVEFDDTSALGVIAEDISRRL